MNQFDILFQALDLIVESKIWVDKKPSDILRILMFMHNKGWLYTPMVDNKIKAVIGAYRIKDINDTNLTKIPISDEGNILYVPFIVSFEKDSNLFHIVRESCKIYLDNNPDIMEIALEDKNNKIKKYTFKSLVKV